MKKLILFAAAPLALIAGCSSETQTDTAADDATATTSEMPSDETMGTTGDAAGTMQSDGTGATGTTGMNGATGTTGTTGSGDTTTDQMGRDTNTGTGTGTGTNNSSGNGTGTTTPPQ